MLRIGTRTDAPRFGDLGVKLGYMSPPALEGALVQQKESGGRRLLGELLVEGGILTEHQVQDLVSEQDRIAMSSSDAAEEADESLRRIGKTLRKVRTKRG